MAHTNAVLDSLDRTTYNIPREALYGQSIIESSAAYRADDPGRRRRLNDYAETYRINNGITDEEAAQAHRDNMERQVQGVPLLRNPSAERRERQAIEMWRFTLDQKGIEFTTFVDDYSLERVKKYYRYFLPTAVRKTPHPDEFD